MSKMADSNIAKLLFVGQYKHSENGRCAIKENFGKYDLNKIFVISKNTVLEAKLI